MNVNVGQIRAIIVLMPNLNGSSLSQVCSTCFLFFEHSEVDTTILKQPIPWRSCLNPGAFTIAASVWGTQPKIGGLLAVSCYLIIMTVIQRENVGTLGYPIYAIMYL